MMTSMLTPKPLLTATLLLLTFFSVNAQARVNIINTGLSFSYDLDDRRNEDKDDDNYQSLAITPKIHLTSTGLKDRFEIRASPSIKYDIIDSETNWDNDLFLTAERSISKNWRLTATDSLLRTDHYESSTRSDTPTTQDSTPELSADFGRARYWRNTFNLTSEHLYGQQSTLNFGFDYNILRNDESENKTYTDYDRYTGSITNQHRFNQKWRAITTLSVVKGTFDDTGPITLLTEESPLSDDLMEYRLRLTGENDFSRQTTVSLSYNYIGTRYDEDLQVDGNVHQAQLRWIHNYSRRTEIILGAGPSYEKAEGQDSNIGGNGVAQITYKGQRGSLTFGIEKHYDAENFAGTKEQGIVDKWETQLNADYQILASLRINGRIRYTYEDRTDTRDTLSDSLASTAPSSDIILEEYHNDIFVSGIGLHYSFLKDYTANLEYTFSKQESDRASDEYDDHRILVSISWAQDIFSW